MRPWPLIVLLVASACAQVRAPDPTPAPTTDPSAGLNVPAGPVLYEPEQLIFPPEDFPIGGLEVARDAPIAVHGWERQFALPASPDFRWFTVRLFVLEPDVTSTRFVADNGCGSVAWPGESPTAKEVLAPRSGDGASACRYDFGDGGRVLYYTTGYRNVGILVAAQPRRDAVGDALAVDWLASIARRQIAIIGGLLARSSAGR